MKNKWRQDIHLEPPRGWLNDPNGLCFFNGKYHVYFQYAPDSAQGKGKKCWGHYESPDLLSWLFTGTVIYPDIPEDVGGAYSGSAVQDGELLYLFYTGNVKEDGDFDYIKSGRQANTIFVTTPDGRSMSKKTVVMRNRDYPAFCSCHVRDPKLWRQDGKWYMIQGARTLEDEGCALIFSSDDLINWSYDRRIYIPDFGYMWECPDLLNVDGREYLSLSPQGVPHGEYGFQNVYSSGYFRLTDGVPTDYREWDKGFDWYAPQTFIAPDGRLIMIGWMGIGDIPYTNPTTDLGWQHCLTVPREITADGDGSLLQNPVRELEKLREDETHPDKDAPFEILLPSDILIGVQDSFKIVLDEKLYLIYDKNVFSLKFTDDSIAFGRDVRKTIVQDLREIRMLCDKSSLEIYLNGGEQVMSTRFYPGSESISCRCEGQVNVTAYKLRPMDINFVD